MIGGIGKPDFGDDTEEGGSGVRLSDDEDLY